MLQGDVDLDTQNTNTFYTFGVCTELAKRKVKEATEITTQKPSLKREYGQLLS
jgi:hypothetical protein